MGKDREGKFHPAKGKPSNDTKEGLGLRPEMEADDLKQDEQMTEKYTTDADKPAAGVHMRHPNRNTGKDENKKEQAHRNPQAIKSINQPLTEELSITEPEELPGMLYKSLFKQVANERAGWCIS